VAEQSFEKRIQDAVDEREAARSMREVQYPGSPEWDRFDHEVQKWSGIIADLRRQAAS
jgi:hypothetical protein